MNPESSRENRKRNEQYRSEQTMNRANHRQTDGQ